MYFKYTTIYIAYLKNIHKKNSFFQFLILLCYLKIKRHYKIFNIFRMSKKFRREYLCLNSPKAIPRSSKHLFVANNVPIVSDHLTRLNESNPRIETLNKKSEYLETVIRLNSQNHLFENQNSSGFIWNDKVKEYHLPNKYDQDFVFFFFNFY